MTIARVELYNRYERIPGTRRERGPYNGWLVARLLPDGRRAETLKRFGRDEAAAREYAKALNESAFASVSLTGGNATCSTR